LIHAPIVGIVLFTSHLNAGVSLQETFVADPVAAGWQIHGSSALFGWNSTDQNLEVTWDSRQGNSYFYRPLGTILTKHDDFALSFNLRLADLQIGIDPAKPFTFQVALGFMNYKSATNSNFLRGTGIDSPNLVTFDYFPDSGFGASVAPAVISSNNQFAFGFTVFELTNDWVHADMRYSAAAQTLTTVVTTNGVSSSPVENQLGPEFTDFRLDTLSINSYSDVGQDPNFAGSILAHGVIDDINLTLPDPPVQGMTGALSDGGWNVTFQSRTGWFYHLERADGFQNWTEVTSSAGNGGSLTLRDSSPVPEQGFYRVRAERL